MSDESLNPPLHEIFSLTGRVALITGGSSGIGRMIAEGFLAFGARVYVTGRRTETCRLVADELSIGGADCRALPGDVSHVEGISQLREDFSLLEPELHILVNNAGLGRVGDMYETSEADWDEVMDLNLKAPFFMAREFGPLLAAGATQNRKSKVINISSIDGLSLNPTELYSYPASKAGLIHLTRRMAVRMAKDNTIVSGIAPGPFPSAKNRRTEDPAYIESLALAAKRAGTVADMAGTAVYLASRAGDFTVGVTIAVDGGMNYSAIDQRPASP